MTTSDRWGVLLLAGALVLMFLLFVFLPLSSFPSEDAAMLYIYSENLADHGVIAYNLADGPAEGATDFLWMVILSGLYKLGCGSHLAATVLSGAAAAGTAWVLTRLANLKGVMAFALVLLLLLGLPPVFAAVQGFSPLFFGFFIALSIYAYVRDRFALLSVAAILTCLVRPDGVVFAVPLVLSRLLLTREGFWRRVGQALLFAGVPGLAYFAWRAHYFGHLFPLPFYVKSHFDRVAGLFCAESVVANMKFVVGAVPFLILIDLGLRRTASRERLVYVLLIVSVLVIPLFFYSSMKLSQNIAYRFQYPLVLCAAAVAFALRPVRPGVRRYLVAGVCSLALLSPLTAIETIRALSVPDENLPYVSAALGKLEGRGTMAVTEAGRLPYYSGWAGIDLWGLNTPALARTVVTPQYIRDAKPDLIVLHDDTDDYSFLGVSGLQERKQRSWRNMTQNTYLGTDGETYASFMVPHMNPERNQGALRPLAGLIPRVKRLLGYEGSFDIYYLFLVRREFAGFDEVSELLADYGAIDVATYFERKAAFLEQ